MKNKKRVKSICSNLMLLFCAIIFFVSVYKLAGYLTEYKKGEQEYSELSSAVTVSTEGQNKAENKSENPPKVDFAKLQAINPDVIGWIMIEGTVINYPIVQGMDNEYYLHKTFRDKTNQGGTIFLDAENQENFTSDNSILYGHNLKTGKMFGSLRFYEDKEYWKDHPYIWVITKKKSMKYQIFCLKIDF